MQPDREYVGTTVVANALGVSDSTVKRWVKSGLLRAYLTPGGHRRVRIADVIRLASERGFPTASLSALIPTVAELPATQELCQLLNQALLDVDGDAVRDLILGAHGRGMGLVTLADEVIAPAMNRVGHGWETGKVSVAQEHRATQLILAVLYELRASLMLGCTEGRPRAVGAAPEHDHYILPSLLAKLVLWDRGWEAVNLGPHTPMTDLARSVEELHPRLIWVSVTYLRDPPAFLQQFRELHHRATEQGVPIVVGGQGLTETLRAEMPGHRHGKSMKDLADFAAELYRLPSWPKRGRPPKQPPAPDSAPSAD
jgi:excisionase family DNA binding protein